MTDYKISSTKEVFTQWAIGDASTAVSIAASGNSTSAALDMREIDRNNGTVQIVLTGTGTGKLTLEGSRDGVSNWHSLGDLVVDMLASPGSYTLALNATGTAYFHFLKITITETGGANAISVKVFIMAQGV